MVDFFFPLYLRLNTASVHAWSFLFGSQTVNFTLMRAIYFCVLINILELCSRTQVLENSLFLLGIAFRFFFFRWAQNSFLSRSNHSSLLRQNPSHSSANAPWTMRCAPRLVGADTFPAMCERQTPFPLILLDGSLPSGGQSPQSTGWSALGRTRGELSPGLWSPSSVRLSPLPHFVL